ncbi:type III secretion system cytoplasmic ring protein SctQ [Candidatus Chlamydia sanziniae]|uniref:Type III secretion inner membrane protein SctQ n=1 Tax=Candidatus Chlamydia sanziniae TaxID=1806891 RepID=A0A1A9HU43_9CHLA|nr:type III secretion system cytoplasmic ring protein SctQ [Candidatus Chlamydia sanziniae]ANH78510.1 Type III secretion inner membrane protein SctQ [Candidatus Chlamydia sanziniae]
MVVAAGPTAHWLKSRNDLLYSLGKMKEDVAVPPFPVEACVRKLKEKFRLEDVEVFIDFHGTLTTTQAVSEFGLHLLIQPMLVQPWDPGNFFFFTSEEDLQELMVAVFNDASLASYFYEKDKLLGFHYYFVAEACKLLEELEWGSSLAVKVAGDVRFTTQELETSYQIVDVTCRLDGHYARFRLLLPDATFQSCQKFFSELNQEFDVHNINQTQLLSMSVEIGYAQLAQEDWHQVVPGSFIVLDSCLYDPETEASGAFVTVQTQHFFGGRFLDTQFGDFKITSYSNLTPEEAPVAEDPKVPAAPLPGYSKLVVEIARYSLPVEEFLKLAPGSVLHLGVNPVRGIDIILDGAKVGRGEIISLGDVLGIRVLEV